MHSRMVPQVIGSPGRITVLDSASCMSLEVVTRKDGPDRDGLDFLVLVRDWDFPGVKEPRPARFYSVVDRDLYLKAVLDDRMKMLARGMPRRAFLYRPRVAA